MIKKLYKKPVIIILISLLILLILICSFIETKYQKSVYYESKKDFINAYNEVKDIRFYKDVNSHFLKNKAFLINYALESSDFSVLKNVKSDNYIMPSFINYDAGIVSYVLKDLDLQYQIEYIDNKDFSCNSIVKQEPEPGVEVKDDEKIILYVNSYWGTNIANINFGFHGSEILVAECGEWLYYVDDGNIIKCRFDFSDKSTIYNSDKYGTLVIEAAKDYIFIRDISKGAIGNIIVITPENKLIYGDTDVNWFMAINNELLYSKNEDGSVL